MRTHVRTLWMPCAHAETQTNSLDVLLRMFLLQSNQEFCAFALSNFQITRLGLTRNLALESFVLPWGVVKSNTCNTKSCSWEDDAPATFFLLLTRWLGYIQILLTRFSIVSIVTFSIGWLKLISLHRKKLDRDCRDCCAKAQIMWPTTWNLV